jgi:hypothetical protein
MKWLFWRMKTFAKRDRTVVKAKFGMTIFISALILFVFWRSANPNGMDPGIPNQSQVQNTIGAMFMMIMTQFMGNTFPNLLVF